MTTALDAKLVPAAKKLLDKFGKSVVLKRTPTSTAYDPTTLEEVRAAEQTQSARITPPEDRITKWIDGRLTELQQGRAYMSPVGLSWPPAQNHKIEIDGVDIEVIWVKKHYSGDDIVLYELRLEAL